MPGTYIAGIVTRRPPERGYLHSLLYALDQLANAALRPVFRRLGADALEHDDETLSSGLGKSYSPAYFSADQACDFCRWFCRRIITPVDNGIRRLRRRERIIDHCIESIEADEGLPPRRLPAAVPPGGEQT